MSLPDEVREDVHRRLRLAEGQVRGVQRMLDEGAGCRDIVTQLSAVTHALEHAGFRVLAAELTACLQGPHEHDQAQRLAEVERLFLKLA